jgi:AhpD family alkylhydroperoxidase
MTHGKDVLVELREPVRDLRQRLPAVFEAYGSIHGAAMADGALDAKTKELIALAIAVSKQCDGCIASHARGAARRGATEEEVAEALGVAILMNGGPGTVHAPRAFSAYREFTAGS